MDISFWTFPSNAQTRFEKLTVSANELKQCDFTILFFFSSSRISKPLSNDEKNESNIIYNSASCIYFIYDKEANKYDVYNIDTF